MIRVLPILVGFWLGLIVVPAGSAAERWVDPVSGLVFLKVPKGCFQMGSAPNRLQVGNRVLRDIGFGGGLGVDEHPRHQVCLSAYWLSETEVTRDAWLRVMGKEAGRVGDADGARPVGGLSWEEATGFARRLTDLSNKGEVFRLPTEAEWEMACLAGREDSGESWKQEAVHLRWMRQATGRSFSAVSSSLQVASREANPWGFRDMLGNVWEWTLDVYDPDSYSRHALFDPRTDSGAQPDRVIRGGSYRSEAMRLRCAARGSYPVSGGLPQIGIRLVREEWP